MAYNLISFINNYATFRSRDLILINSIGCIEQLLMCFAEGADKCECRLVAEDSLLRGFGENLFSGRNPTLYVHKEERGELPAKGTGLSISIDGSILF